MQSHIGANQLIDLSFICIKAGFGFLLGQFAVPGFEIALLVVDDLDILVHAAVLLIAA